MEVTEWWIGYGDLRAVVGRFIEVCSGRGLQVNAGVNKAMLLRGEES